jgi:hypothetical protein
MYEEPSDIANARKAQEERDDKIYYAMLDAIATVRSMVDKARQLHLHLGLWPARLSDPAWAHRRLLGPSRWTVGCCAVCHIPACPK